MALEIWILLTVAAAVAILAAITRLHRKRPAETPQSERNVYPLW